MMKTKEIITGTLFLLGIVILSSACNKDDDEIKLDFNITVPGDWTYYALENENMVYYAQSPKEEATDSILEDLLVTKDYVGNGTLTSFYAAVLEELEQDTSYQEITSVQDTINGETCMRLTHLQTLYMIYSATKDTVNVYTKSLKYVFVHEYNGYVLSFTALTDTYDAYEPVFEGIMETFTFKN
jgi:hypothetical protein